MKSEEKIQQEIVLFFRNNFCLKFHQPKCEMYSIPNVGVAGARHQMSLVSTGLRRGASDLVALLPGPLSIYLEVKTEKGKQSTEQKEFQQNIEALGFKYYLVRSLEEFKEIPEIRTFWVTQVLREK